MNSRPLSTKHVAVTCGQLFLFRSIETGRFICGELLVTMVSIGEERDVCFAIHAGKSVNQAR